jgi:hypothetical protein
MLSSKYSPRPAFSGGNTKSAPVDGCSFCELGNLHGKFLQNFPARMEAFIYLGLAGQAGSQTRLHFTYASKHFYRTLIEDCFSTRILHGFDFSSSATAILS